jgi:ribonuclease HI
MNETLTLHFDGGSRGNPGEAGAGIVVLAADGTPLVTIGKYIGRATNNVAEYRALIFALREAEKLNAKKVIVRGDSELVIKQMRGEYRVKNPALRDLYEKAQSLAGKFDEIKFEHKLRDDNALADRLANKAMDRKGDVDDDDLPSQSVAASPPALPRIAPTAKENPILTCTNCGSKIQIVKPPQKPGSFHCPCGGGLRYSN